MSRLAYIIGNADYKHMRKLNNPLNDVDKMEEALRKANFEVKSYKDLDREVFADCMYEFTRSLVDINVALFYYAGHGLEHGGKNYLVPCDAEINLENIEKTCIDITNIVVEMYQERNFTSIIILDCCRENLENERSFSQVQYEGGELKVFNATEGAFISYATSPGKKASDGIGDNGLFTGILCDYILEEGVKIEELFKKVRREVIEKSNLKQIPWEHSSLIGDFYFIEPKEKINQLLEGSDCFSKVDQLCNEKCSYREIEVVINELWENMHPKLNECFKTLGIYSKQQFLICLLDYIDDTFIMKG